MGPSMIIFLIILILIVIFGYIFLVHLEVGVGNLFLIYIENIDMYYQYRSYFHQSRHYLSV